MMTKLKFALIVFFLYSAVAWSQQVTEPAQGPTEEALPEEAEQQQWATAFQEAEKIFNSEEQSNSVPMFQSLIEQLTEQRLKRTLSAPEQQILFRSLDYLGQAFFLDGQRDAAGRVFLKLVELNPNYALNESLVSGKIIDFFQQLKKENLGMLQVSSEPTGATVKLDGQTMGVTDLAALYSLKGDHEIELSKPGFVAQKQIVTVNPQKTAKVAIKLERSSSVGYFVTYPKDVELFMDGKSIGVASGEATQRGLDTATLRNLPPSEFSGEFLIPDLLPGTYELEFRKPCWEGQTRRITIDKNDDYFFEPIVLEPSIAFLNITADDEKANIIIDEEYIGIAPKQKLKICSGNHLIKLKGPRGKFERRFHITKNQTLDIAARLNPSITFVGLLGDADTRRSDVEKLNPEVVKMLSDLQNLNFVDYSGGLDASVEQSLAKIIEGIDTNKPDKDRIGEIQKICAKVESDLLLVGLVQKESILRNVRFYLLSNWSSMADIRAIQIFDASQWKKFKEELEYEEPLYQKRLGVHMIDTEITQGPVISSVLLKTGDEGQPLVVGDVITAINEKPVKSALEVQQVLMSLQGNDPLKLSVLRAGAPTSLSTKLVSSPMEIQFNNPSLLFNRQLIAFRKAITLSTNTLEKNVALLNLGLCHMHFAEYEQAFEQLRQVQLSREVGIGPGTVAYRIAQCYRELGYSKEAAESLEEAAKHSQNTIFSDDGPSLAREIQRARLSLN